MNGRKNGMDRRLFLASALGIGTLAAGGPASAFQIASCDAEGNTPGCRALDEHAALLHKIDAALAEQGLNEQERKTVIARLSCPTCGLPLAGTIGTF
jgi:hypothetical protein